MTLPHAIPVSAFKKALRSARKRTEEMTPDEARRDILEGHKYAPGEPPLKPYKKRKRLTSKKK